MNSCALDVSSMKRVLLWSTTAMLTALAFGCGSSNDNGVDGAGVGGGFNVGSGGVGGTLANGVGSTGNGVGSSGNGVGSSGNTGGCVVGAQGCSCDSAGFCASGMTCDNGTCCNSSSGSCARLNTGTGGAGSTNVHSGCVGAQGCYCDSLGACSSGQTCNVNICCNSASSDCTYTGGYTNAGGGTTSTNNGTGSSTGIGSTTGTGSTGSTGPSVCAPGVVGPVITDCGYPYTSNYPLTATVFNENECLAGIVPTGGMLAKVQVFYGDEHALTLGVRSVVVKTSSGTTTTDYPISALTSSPSTVLNPQTGTNVLFGDQAGLDPYLRPMWPTLFITDITNDPNSRSGDWQYGGRPYNPSAVYGTWKAAVRTYDKTAATPFSVTTPDADPAKNDWNLGSGADPVPSTLAKNQGYGAEIVWNLSLIPGHSYRVQAIVHDGDQNKAGGDSGEACVNYCAGGDTPPPDGGTDSGTCSGSDCTGTTPPPPPVCQEGQSYCGPGGIDPLDCPIGYWCSNGCCTWNVG